MKTFYLALLTAFSLAAQNAALAPPVHQQFFDANGKPLAGGTIYTCLANTDCPGNPLASYTTSAATVTNSNPVVLDASGYATIWIKAGPYKFAAFNVTGVKQWEQDYVSGLGLTPTVPDWTAVEGQPNGLATLDGSGHVPSTQLFYSQGATNAVTRSIKAKLQESVSAEDFSGGDCGANINSAYAALPATGGTITVHTACSFTTPIVFGTANKPVILQGSGPGSALTYTATSGTAITLNNGINFDFTTRLQDIALHGPGAMTGTIGVFVGGTHGCVGCGIDHGVIDSFGANLKTGDNEWLFSVHNTMIRNGFLNVLMPSGTLQAGENIQFDHVTFADAPAPHTNSVWIQGGGQEVIFRDCSFDHAQLRIGNGATSAAQVVITGTHFENPNFAVSGSVSYPYIVVDNHNGNFVRLTDSYFLQDNPGTPPAHFAEFNGGKIVITGIGMYTPVPMTNFATLANAVNVDLFSFNDLSGSLTGSLLGGTTTGFVAAIPGANTGGAIPLNVVYKPADAIGGAAMDFHGNIRTDNQLVSIVGTGTAPFIVNSSTPVTNLFGGVLNYDNTGTQVVGATKTVSGGGTLSAGSVNITFSGAAIFANSSSYSCTVTDRTGPNGIQASATSGTQLHVVGTGSDQFSYLCIGN